MKQHLLDTFVREHGTMMKVVRVREWSRLDAATPPARAPALH
jgi:hypothetical protein